jgi:serine/threonine protein kinase
LGRGGFGEVWEGIGPDGERVALKFLDCRHKSSAVVANEIRQLLHVRELLHPHLIQVHNVYAARHYIILNMELADGSLADLHDEYRTHEQTHLPPDLLCDLLGQAATALDFLAAQRLRNGFSSIGLQHCDVKPSNLLLVGNYLKVADFGLCMPQIDSGKRRFLGGTPPYAAPELYEGRLTERTDQYALAVTYCELRCGRWPFPRVRGRRPQMLPDLGQIPEPERPILARALEAKYLNRWPSCEALMEELRLAVERSASPKTGLPCPSRGAVVSACSS